MSVIINGTTGITTPSDTTPIVNSSTTLSLQTGGTAAVTVDASQNVGIGTSSPSTYGKFAVFGANQTNIITASYADTSFQTYIDAAIGEVRLKAADISGANNSKFMSFYTHPSGSSAVERMRIDSNGNVLVGLSGLPSTYGKLTIGAGALGGTTGNTLDYATYYSTTSNANYLRFYEFRNATGTDWTTATTRIAQITDSTLQSYIDFNPVGGNYAMAFGTGSGASERMRIDSSGNVLIGTTSTIGVNNELLHVKNVNGGNRAIAVGNSGGSSATGCITFFNSNGAVGSIITTGSSTNYNTSSDYRLKENIAPMVGALDTVAALKPVTYKWKQDGSNGQGFIAHELAEVVPDCVTGEKDAVETYTDEDGIEQTRPVYQGIDTSFLVATLTAAIQELSAKVAALEAQLQAE